MSSPTLPSSNLLRSLAALGLFTTAAAAWGQTAAPAAVRFAEVRAAPSQAPLRLPARTAPAEIAQIYSRASGVVSERHADLGDTVKRGDLLARISAPEVGRQHAGAQARVLQAQARQQLARANLQRADSLVGQGYVSHAHLDALKAELSIATADVAAASFEVERLGEIMEFQQIRAPMDGRIVERRIERGDRVSGDSTNETRYLFRIARLDELRIEVDVPQAESLRMKPGTAATLRFAELPGEVLKAAVARTSGTIDARTGTMRVELRLPNPGMRLPAGIRGEIELETSTSPLVAIPMNALLIRQGKPSVAVRVADRLRFREVTVAYSTDREVFIRSGLVAGEQVAQSPNALLLDGAVVAASK